MAVSRLIETDGRLEAIEDTIRQVAADPLVKAMRMLWIIGIKTFLDGGMLTGSACMLEPWGVSQIYSIRDPQYRGVRFIPQDRLVPIVETTVESGLQFTAHARRRRGGAGAARRLRRGQPPASDPRHAAVHHPLELHEPPSRSSRRHGWACRSTFSRPGCCSTARRSSHQFGYERLRYFQPLQSIFAAGAIAGGGSDHMQKIGALRSINFYDPFLAMQTTVARIPRGSTSRCTRRNRLTASR